MKLCNIFLVVIFTGVVFILCQSIYSEINANHTEIEYLYLVELVRMDMKDNFRRIDAGLPIRQDTVLTKAVEKLRHKKNTQLNESILYKYLKWKII